MDCLEVHTIKRKRIDGLKIDDFIEKCDSQNLYLIDIDPYFGKEMNFKVYRELSGIYDLWIDAASRRIEDVMDVLVSDADVAVITGVYFWDSLKDLIDLTDNVAMKSIYEKHIDEFVKLGGKIVILPRNMANRYNVEVKIFTKKGVCDWKT